MNEQADDRPRCPGCGRKDCRWKRLECGGEQFEKPCRGMNSNVCVAEGCFGEACVEIASDRTE